MTIVWLQQHNWVLLLLLLLRHYTTRPLYYTTTTATTNYYDDDGGARDGDIDFYYCHCQYSSVLCFGFRVCGVGFFVYGLGDAGCISCSWDGA